MANGINASNQPAFCIKRKGLLQAHSSGMSVFLVTTALFLNGCNEVTKPTEPAIQSSEIPAVSNQPVKAEMGAWGIETNHIAKDIKPGDDFYRYVNKGWLDTTIIPQGMSGIDSFAELGLKTEKKLTAIIQDALVKNASQGTPEQQIADFYTSYTDIQGRNSRGFEMLKPDLTEILSAKDRSELAERMGRAGYSGLFSVGTSIDVNNPQRYILEMFQSGLGLPSRDYYLEKNQPFIGHRSAYLSYIEGVLNRAGIANAKSRAKAVLAFESKIAKLHWPVEQGRDPVKNNHVMSKDELMAFAPGFDWSAFLKSSGYDGVNTVKVNSDTAIKGMAALFNKTPLNTLRDYLAFQYLNNYAELLSEEWSDAYFDLFSRRLQGIDQPRPLEERALVFVNTHLGEEMGKLYVERYFPAESKAKTEEMVGFIKQSMQQHLEQLDWMDDATRKSALAKLANFKTNIGYPDQWHDYSTMQISNNDLVANMLQISNWYRKDSRAKLDEPVRTWEWGHNPQEINAYYAPDRNQIVFLAGILQAPFFDPNADPAVNFGAIGMVIGHEIGHGFDDQGSQFDGEGKLRNWWSQASAINFKVKTDKLVTQYNAYTPLKGLHVNGQLTLGENIGDMSGVAVAYTAYQKYAAAKYPNATPPVLDGYTGNQRFFMGYAQLWRTVWTDETLRMIVLTNPHSPGEYRVNGILTNFDPCYEAFGVKENDALFLPKNDRISIW